MDIPSRVNGTDDDGGPLDASRGDNTVSLTVFLVDDETQGLGVGVRVVLGVGRVLRLLRQPELLLVQPILDEKDLRHGALSHQ
jgi:hypothetical protein